MLQSQNLMIYQAEDGNLVLDVPLAGETVWLSLSQMATLFDRDKSVISRHIKSVFELEELDPNSAIACFATVQQEGTRQVERQLDYYNLDVIISVGYRVNSKRGVQFRRWANTILKDYLFKGYALNTRRLDEEKINDLTTSLQNFLLGPMQAHMDIIRSYAKTWDTLLRYDEGRLDTKVEKPSALVDFTEAEARQAIRDFKERLVERGEAGTLFGHERHDGLGSIIGALSQTFDGVPVYPTNELRAANLLYLIIKDHPFSDGNKRIACLLFLLFLVKIGCDLAIIPNNTLVMLALFIAESHPRQKDVMIQLIDYMLQGGVA